MLIKLIIKNVALIDSAEIDFKNGLNVLSGETGAGKSVILESINFVLGAKADKTLIRSGESECFVSAIFDLEENSPVYSVFDELDIEKEDQLIITRKFNLDGKSFIKINGASVTVAMLKKFTSVLVDVHGQSEHFYLLKPENQAALIDKFGGEEISNLKNENKSIFTEYSSVKASLSSLGGEERKRAMRLDVLNYQISEIETANLKEDEEEEFKSLREKIKNREKIVFALSSIKSSISEEGGVLDILSNSERVSFQISNLSDEYSSVSNRLSSAYSELEDIASTVSALLDVDGEEDISLDFIEERLELIKNLKRKYGENYNDIVSYLENAIKERDNLLNFDVLSQNLLQKKTILENHLYKNYLNLNQLRRKTAKQFSELVSLELKGLGMQSPTFYVEFNDLPSFDDCKFTSYNGLDEMQFMFSANAGEPSKPLSLVISGGEMSRFMLAIKVVASKINDISTFIFDEIDAGISGVTAGVVAEKFAKISKETQIIAISHLPQISAMADNNLLILKTFDGKKTYTKVNMLEKNDKINEVIRLFGGNVLSESAKALAKELVLKAENFKNNI